MNRVVLAVLILTVLYAAVLTRFDLADLLFAALVSVLLLRALRGYLFEGTPDPVPGLFRRCWAFFPFAGVVLRDVVTGAWQVTLIVLGRRPAGAAGTVAIDVGERSPTGVAVGALVHGLSPGAVAVEANEDVMLFHVLDASDPDQVRARHERFYQRHQKQVFP